MTKTRSSRLNSIPLVRFTLKIMIFIMLIRVLSLPGRMSALERTLSELYWTRAYLKSSVARALLWSCSSADVPKRKVIGFKHKCARAPVRCSIATPKMLIFNFFASSTFKPAISLSNLQNTETLKLTQNRKIIKLKD